MFGLNRRHINNGHTAQSIYILQLGRKVAIIHLVKVRASKGLHKAILLYVTSPKFSFSGNVDGNTYIHSHISQYNSWFFNT